MAYKMKGFKGFKTSPARFKLDGGIPKGTSTTKRARIGKATKFLGGKAMGVAGMMMGSIGTADANPANKGKMTMKQEKDLVSRIKNMKKK